MSDFAGNEELLQDFMTEALELLSDLDNKLVGLERSPGDRSLLNDIFRSFHTIKGGAGFLGVTELVRLCHLTENLFDKLRNGELSLTPAMLDIILEATGVVRDMFGHLGSARQPPAADERLIGRLKCAIEGSEDEAPADVAESQTRQVEGEGPDWSSLHASLFASDAPAAASSVPSKPHLEVVPRIERRAPAAVEPAVNNAPRATSPGRRATDDPAADGMRSGRRDSDKVVVARESTIRIDTARLDQVLNLSGEIGLTKNRLNCLRTEMMAGKTDPATIRAVDEAVSQLDLLVGDLQNAVMKTRMQPVGRLFQKYPRLVRDVARSLGKEVDLELEGEDTELDRTMIEELGDPLVHLLRNAVDHGLESPEERRTQGKPETGKVRLAAQQAGDHIVLEISDDGRGMRPDILRRKAMEKGLIDAETANSLDDKQSFHLIFLPGFSTKEQVSSVSGRGVGMDVVKTNIQKLNGRIEIQSVPGQGSTFLISLPLTLAILPVLVVRLGEQPFAIPLTMVREIIPFEAKQVQAVSGKATMVVRDEVLPVRSLSGLLGWDSCGTPAYGVLLQGVSTSLVLAVDGFVGRDDVVIKPLDVVKPKGIAGATLNGDGSVVLVLDMEELLRTAQPEQRASLFARAA